MIPIRVDFDLRTNADYGESFEVKDGTTVQDLTGRKFRLQARNASGLTLLNFAPSVDNGSIDILFSRGTIKTAYETLEDEQPSPIRSVSYDMRATLPDGKTEVWLEGTINIREGITQ
jgi:hypothetical protein